ncbi:hypothetical protein CRG98_018109 [Punica granatum]|nr:hypothetical protein CRG98_018109 [Punica granatum]
MRLRGYPTAPGAAAIVLLLLASVQPNDAMRWLDVDDDEDYQHAIGLLLHSLQKGPVRPPRSGCTGIPESNNPPCPNINNKNFAGRTMAPPNAYPGHRIQFGVAA